MLRLAALTLVAVFALYGLETGVMAEVTIEPEASPVRGILEAVGVAPPAEELVDPDEDGVSTERDDCPNTADPDVTVVVLECGWNMVAIPASETRATVGEILNGRTQGTPWAWDARRQVYTDATDEPVSRTAGYWVYALEYCGVRLR